MLGLYLLVGVVFLAVAIVALLIALGVIGQRNKAVRERLKIANSVAAVKVAQESTVIKLSEEESGVTRFFSKATVAKIDRNLLLAGRPEGWTVTRVVTLRIIATVLGVFVAYTMISGGSTLTNWAVGVVAIGIGWFGPVILLQNRAAARQKSIQQELPDVLDQVTISIESGMGFEAAFAHIGERRTGPLAEEIVRVVQDMRLGMSRREAYEAMAERNDVADLRNFVKSVVQAEQYGVSISRVVRTQATEIRFGRRKRAEAAALKVPVKILFPLMLCIFPVLFIVILTPAFISIGDALGSR